MIAIIENNLEKISMLCEKYKVISLAIFGSAAKDSMTNDSDIDFLVQFSPNLDVLDYADNYFSLKEELEQMTGMPIDLVSLKSLKNPILIDEINRFKVDLYAA